MTKKHKKKKRSPILKKRIRDKRRPQNNGAVGSGNWSNTPSSMESLELCIDALGQYEHDILPVYEAEMIKAKQRIAGFEQQYPMKALEDYYSSINIHEKNIALRKSANSYLKSIDVFLQEIVRDIGHKRKNMLVYNQNMQDPFTARDAVKPYLSLKANPSEFGQLAEALESIIGQGGESVRRIVGSKYETARQKAHTILENFQAEIEAEIGLIVHEYGEIATKVVQVQIYPRSPQVVRMSETLSFLENKLSRENLLPWAQFLTKYFKIDKTRLPEKNAWKFIIDIANMDFEEVPKLTTEEVDSIYGTSNYVQPTPGSNFFRNRNRQQPRRKERDYNIFKIIAGSIGSYDRALDSTLASLEETDWSEPKNPEKLLGNMQKDIQLSRKGAENWLARLRSRVASGGYMEQLYNAVRADLDDLCEKEVEVLQKIGRAERIAKEGKIGAARITIYDMGLSPGYAQKLEQVISNHLSGFTSEEATVLTATARALIGLQPAIEAIPEAPDVQVYNADKAIEYGKKVAEYRAAVKKLECQSGGFATTHKGVASLLSSHKSNADSLKTEYNAAARDVIKQNLHELVACLDELEEIDMGNCEDEAAYDLLARVHNYMDNCVELRDNAYTNNIFADEVFHVPDFARVAEVYEKMDIAAAKEASTQAILQQVRVDSLIRSDIDADFIIAKAAEAQKLYEALK